MVESRDTEILLLIAPTSISKWRLQVIGLFSRKDILSVFALGQAW